MKYQLYNNNGILGIHIISSESNAIDVSPSKIVDPFDMVIGFLPAYEFDEEKGYSVNIEKAKKLQLDKFREARKKLWPELDAEYFKAIESNNESSKQEIASIKQELRNITKIDMPNDIIEISNFWPEILLK